MGFLIDLIFDSSCLEIFRHFYLSLFLMHFEDFLSNWHWESFWHNDLIFVFYTESICLFIYNSYKIEFNLTFITGFIEFFVRDQCK